MYDTTGRNVSLVLLAGLLALVGMSVPAQAAQAATIVVYYDLDNDGLRDPGEPGVPDQALSSRSTALTDARGRARVDVADGARVRLSTGWYRSDCDRVFCDASSSDQMDNDFRVRNQFLLLEQPRAGEAYHVGLVPDWPGDYEDMPSRFGWNDRDGDDVLDDGEPTGRVNEVDVSTRLSWGNAPGAECNRTREPSDRACRPGDRPRVGFQVMNEGTTRVTGVRGMLEMPFTGELTAEPSTRPFNQPGLDLVIGDWDPVSGGYPWEIEGAMGIGAVAQFKIDTTVPDVVRESPTRSAHDHTFVNRITSVDQWSDQHDLDSARCTVGPARSCRAFVGKHDKQGSPVDDSDDVGFTIVGVDEADDLGDVTDLALMLRPTIDEPTDPGQAITYQLQLLNQGTRNVRNPLLVLHVPDGLSFSPGDNPGWTSDASTVYQGQVAAGATATLPVVLRLAADATPDMNGTSHLRTLAEVGAVFDAESGTFQPDDVDSTPDLDPFNDGYDVTDPWRATGDDVVTNGTSTIGTRSGGEDDQDPASTEVGGRATTPTPPPPEEPADGPACTGTRSGSTVTLTFSGDLGRSLNLRRDGRWLAAVTGQRSHVDRGAPADSNYLLRVRGSEYRIDVECDVES